MSVANFVDTSLVTRLRGTFGGGGGGVTLQREFVDAPGQVVAPGPVTLDWTHASGDALLDYTTPNLPIVLAGGCYALTVSVRGSASSALGGTINGQVAVTDGPDASIQYAAQGEVGTTFPPWLSFALVTQANAGAILECDLFIGIAEILAYQLTAVVQRIA